jgi:hypothetical protein
VLNPIVFGKSIAARFALAGLCAALTLVLIGAFLEWSSRDIFFVGKELEGRPSASVLSRADVPDPRSRDGGDDRCRRGAEPPATPWT